MATTEKSRRTLELEAAAEERERAQADLDRAQAFLAGEEATVTELEQRRASLQEELRNAVRLELSEDRWHETAQRVRGEIKAVDTELEHHREIRQIAFERFHQEVFGEHVTASVAHQGAQRNLRREPCEMALLELDRLFRAAETIWNTVAAHEARTLEQQGDVWGAEELRRMAAALGPGVLPEGHYHKLQLPRFPAAP